MIRSATGRSTWAAAQAAAVATTVVMTVAACAAGGQPRGAATTPARSSPSPSEAGTSASATGCGYSLAQFERTLGGTWKSSSRSAAAAGICMFENAEYVVSVSRMPTAPARAAYAFDRFYDGSCRPPAKILLGRRSGAGPAVCGGNSIVTGVAYREGSYVWMLATGRRSNDRSDALGRGLLGIATRIVTAH